MGLGAPEILIVLVVVLIVFGAGRLGDIGSALPKAVKNFQAGSRGELPDEPEPTDESAPERPRSTVVNARRPQHRFRPIGMLLLGSALLLWYADYQWFQIGLPLQIAAGALGVLGALVYLFL